MTSALGDQLPPQNLEAERKTLGSCLIERSAIDEIVDIVRPEDFYRESHATICREIFWLYGQGKPVDFVTLAERLEQLGELQDIGGDNYLGEISAATPHAANARYHAGIVRELAKLRRVIEACTEIIREGYERRGTASEIIRNAESRIFAVTDDAAESSDVSFAEMLGQSMYLVERRKQGEIDGIMTGLAGLDDTVGGLRPGQLVVIAARPSMGKTALAMEIAVHAGQIGHVVVFSMEMSRQELGMRMLGNRAGVNTKKFDDPAGCLIKDPNSRMVYPYLLTADDEVKMRRAVSQAESIHLTVDDRPRLTVAQIASKVRRVKHRSKVGLSLVVVDYLSLMDGGRLKNESRQEEVARSSTAFKALAKDFGVPFVVLSQLNRKNEERADKRPMLSDLRESGQVEQDADVAIMLHRPDFYDLNDMPGLAEAIVAKNRNGPTGTVKLRFYKEITKFEDYIEGYNY